MEEGTWVDGKGLEGYFLAAVPAAARPALEAEEPMVGCAFSWKRKVGGGRRESSKLKN